MQNFAKIDKTGKTKETYKKQTKNGCFVVKNVLLLIFHIYGIFETRFVPYIPYLYTEIIAS